jgi:hypothetical protein
MYITHSQYDSNLSAALSNVGSFVASAFNSGFWTSTAPILGHHNDISRFKSLIDSHQEGRFKLITEVLLKNKISDFELYSLNNLISSYFEFCSFYNLPFDSKSNSIYSSLYQARLIQEIHSSNLKDLIIYEIGPGSGFLSVLLTLMGAKVFSIECVQSHYVYQSYFYDFVFKDNFSEKAFSSNFNITDFDCSINHLPWWKICHPDSPLPPADVIISNHMLMETSNGACDFYRFFSNKLLKNTGSWIIEGFGAHYNGGPNQNSFINEIPKMGLNFYDLTSFYSHYGVYLISKDIRTQVSFINASINLKDSISSFEIKFPSLIDNNFLSNSRWIDFVKIDPNFGSRIKINSLP